MLCKNLMLSKNNKCMKLQTNHILTHAPPPNFLCIAWYTVGSQITSTLHVWLDKSIIIERNNLVIINIEVQS